MIDTGIVRDKIAFDHTHRGYRFLATYLVTPKSDALIEISKDGVMVRSTLWPAYKVWNISAHADDIVDGLEQGNSSGLYAAGSLGPFGGNVFSEPKG